MSSNPPIYSTADEASAWDRFTAPAGSAEFCQSWLAILCGQVEHVQAAMLLLTPGADSTFLPGAIWPGAERDVRYLVPTAQRALTERRGVVVGPDGESAPRAGQPAHVGYPVELDGTLVGAVVLDIAPGAVGSLQRSLRLVHWASAWLVAHFCRQQLAERDVRLAGLKNLTDLMAATLQDRRFVPSALAVVNEVCARLHCDRVSLGVERHGDVEVKAISHTASFDRKSDLVRLIAQAMDEVIDLDVALVERRFKKLDHVEQQLVQVRRQHFQFRRARESEELGEQILQPADFPRDHRQPLVEFFAFAFLHIAKVFL